MKRVIYIEPIIEEGDTVDELFRKYKEKETDLNILILKINKELKQITKKDKCGL